MEKILPAYKISKNSRKVARLLLVGIMCIFSTPFSQKLEAQVLNEDPLKANYLLGFVDFIHWDRNEKNPIVIGIVGDSSLGREIDSLAKKKKALGATRSFEVKTLKGTEEEIKTVDVLYFSDQASSKQWDTIIPYAKKYGILTVADTSGFLDSGGLIEFVIRRNRLRFSLNLEASEEYSITVSSKLARLAVAK